MIYRTHEPLHEPVTGPSRTLTESEGNGFDKVLAVSGEEKDPGATIVGDNAGELIGELVIAIRHGLGLNRILRAAQPSPP